jgi:glycosyltransferase involved in cell wall biosynthesis
LRKTILQPIVFTGYQRDITSIYKSLDLVILPSLSEGMPNVALEGMLFGKPVIGTKVGGIPEVIIDQRTGMIVPAADPDSLSWAILELLKDKNKMRTFSDNSQKYVLENFSLKKRVSSIVEFYRELIDSR